MPLGRDEAYNKGAFTHGLMSSLYRCWEEGGHNGTKAEYLEETCKAQIPQTNEYYNSIIKSPHFTSKKIEHSQSGTIDLGIMPPSRFTRNQKKKVALFCPLHCAFPDCSPYTLHYTPHLLFLIALPAYSPRLPLHPAKLKPMTR